MKENIPNINSNCLCVYLFIQVFVCFCFSYTNFSHFSMMNFFYNQKNTILKKRTVMYLIMYIKYTHQLRSTFNCYVPYVKGHFWEGYQLLLSIFFIISSIMVIFVCSNLIEVIIGHNARCIPQGQWQKCYQGV